MHDSVCILIEDHGQDQDQTEPELMTMTIVNWLLTEGGDAGPRDFGTAEIVCRAVYGNVGNGSWNSRLEMELGPMGRIFPVGIIIGQQVKGEIIKIQFPYF